MWRAPEMVCRQRLSQARGDTNARGRRDAALASRCMARLIAPWSAVAGQGDQVTHVLDRTENAGGPHAARCEHLFRTLLGRPPAEGELADLPQDPSELTAALTQSVEYRNRFREAGNAAEAASLWPNEARPHDLHIFVVSGDPWSKSEATLQRLAPRLGGRVVMTIVSGQEDPRPFPVQEGLELVVIPGQSVFQLRAKLPGLMKEAAWIVSIEDHSVPTEEWLDGVLAAIAVVPPEQLAITGTAANLDSTAPWDWANFLFNFYRHWHPSDAPELTGTVATTVFRRDIVGTRSFRIHEYEQFVLGRPMAVSNAFPINHIQRTSLWEASIHVLDNGLVFGSSLRRHSDSPRVAVMESVRWTLGGRMREIAEVLARHPRAAELPPGTVRRIRWVAWCHSLGVVTGALFGGGRAHLRLE
ncbi:MAG: hypothetical protein FD152_2838 [Xanthobacteraceae bacterium]|nr:MAG: hypothetical protein FD152_2838 [Xanthobacteraceae bacterium]